MSATERAAERPSAALRWAVVALSACALLAANTVWAQPADAERAQRRLQQQMQALQQQLQAAQAAKAQADTEREELNKKLGTESRAAARARQALRQADVARKALEQERSALRARVAALDTQAIEQKRIADDTLAGRSRDMAQQGRTHDTAVVGWRNRLQQQTELLTECSVKNQRLLALGAELANQYRHKTVADVMRQREPLLGLGQVKLFDEMQTLRDRREAERFDPAQPAAPQPPPSPAPSPPAAAITAPR